VQQVGDFGGGHATGGEQDHHRSGGDPPLAVQGGDEFGVLLVGEVGEDVGRAHTGGGSSCSDLCVVTKSKPGEAFACPHRSTWASYGHNFRHPA
jgi:hypothetical protein